MASHLLSPESRRGQVFSASLFDIMIALMYLVWFECDRVLC